jgi:hypothetical protein
MANTIQLLRSTTAGNKPSSLASGQIAINERDGVIYYRDAATGSVKALPTGGSSLVSYATTASFPATGSSGTLYLASDTSKIYRWESTVYVEIGTAGSSQGVTTLSQLATNMYLWANFR